MAFIVGSAFDTIFQTFKASIEKQVYDNVIKVYDDLKCDDVFTPRFGEITESDIDRMPIYLNEPFYKTTIKNHLKLIKNDATWIIAIQFCTILYPSNDGLGGINSSSKKCICYINNCGNIAEFNETHYSKSWTNLEAIKKNDPDSCLPDALIGELKNTIGQADLGQRRGEQSDLLSQQRNLFALCAAYKSMLKYRQKYSSDIMTLKKEIEDLKAVAKPTIEDELSDIHGYTYTI